MLINVGVFLIKYHIIFITWWIQDKFVVPTGCFIFGQTFKIKKLRAFLLLKKIKPDEEAVVVTVKKSTEISVAFSGTITRYASPGRHKFYGENRSCCLWNLNLVLVEQSQVIFQYFHHHWQILIHRIYHEIPMVEWKNELCNVAMENNQRV